MSDYHASHEAGSYGVRMVIGAGVSLLGAITLDQWALLAGILCSLVVTGHTLWRGFNEWRDRAARKKAAEDAKAQAEPWL